MVIIPEPCKELRRRISAAIYGWDCPLPTFIYPGFDCGSSAVQKGSCWGGGCWQRFEYVQSEEVVICTFTTSCLIIPRWHISSSGNDPRCHAVLARTICCSPVPLGSFNVLVLKGEDGSWRCHKTVGQTYVPKIEPW